MSNVNICVLAGRLTRDPRLNEGENYSIADFGLAINETFKDKEYTTFVDVKVFGPQAQNVAKYLTKGKGALVRGSLRVEEYTAKDGSKAKKTFVRAERVEFLGGPLGKAESPKGKTGTNAKAAAGPVSSTDDDESIPF